MNEPRHPSSLALDQVLVGSADPGVTEHVASCKRCQTRLERMGASRETFLAAYPSLDRLPARSPPRRAPARLRFAWGGGALALAAAAAVVVALVPPEEQGVRSKGGSVIEIAVGRDGDSKPFTGQSLRAGDKLAFRYSTPHRYLMLASVEASGQISILLPADRSSSLEIEPGNKMRLAHGIELDDYPGPEVLIAVLTPEPLDAAEVIEALDAGFAALPDTARADLELPELELAGDHLSWRLTKDAL